MKNRVQLILKSETVPREELSEIVNWMTEEWEATLAPDDVDVEVYIIDNLEPEE